LISIIGTIHPYYLSSYKVWTVMTMKKGLDRTAFALIGLMIISILALLYGRSYFTTEAINARIGGIASANDQQLWVALPQKILIVNPKGKVLRQFEADNLGVKSLIVDMAFKAANTVWLRDVTGEIYLCHLDQLPCKHINIQQEMGSLTYAKLTASPDGSVLLLTDNERGKVYSVNKDGAVLSKSLSVLNHPNGALFTDQGVVQADTGGNRLIRWPYIKGGFQPDFNVPHELVLKTFVMHPMPTIPKSQTLTLAEAQKIGEELMAALNTEPYFFEQMADHSWWILEGGATLKNGTLRQYDPQGKPLQTIALPIADPIVMAKLNPDTLVLADMASSTLVAVNYQTSTFYDKPLLGVNVFGDSDLKDALALVDRSRKQYQWVSEFCVGLIVLLPVLFLLMFRRLGYDLNAKL
jgi:hypothetical protein